MRVPDRVANEYNGRVSIGKTGEVGGYGELNLANDILLCIRQTLFVAQLRVPQAEGESDQKNSETDTGDAKQSLSMLIRGDDGSPLRRADGILGNHKERVRVRRSSQGRVSQWRETVFESRGEDVRPDGTRDAATKRRTDVVCGEVQTGDDGDVFVLCRGLDRRLGRVREHTARKTKQDLSADDARLA